VPLRGSGEPVLNLRNPPGIDAVHQRRCSPTPSRQLNSRHLDTLHDPRLPAGIAQYELAFRMQASAPELTDLSAKRQRRRCYGGTANARVDG